MLSTSQIILFATVTLISSSINLLITSPKVQPNNDSIPAFGYRAILYKSFDHGQTWVPLSTELPHETQVAFMEKKGERIVLATDNTGIYLSDEKKENWKQIGNQLPGMKITALYVSGEEIFAGVYEKGIFVSQNEGESWESLNADLENLKVHAILKANDEFIVATDVGIFKRSHDGLRWLNKFSGSQVISLNSQDGKIIAGGVLGTMISTDNGESWDWILQEGAAHNTCIIDGKVIVMNISGDVFTSNDWGKTWKQFVYQPRDKSYVYDIIKVKNDLLMTNNYGIHYSNDDGKNWKNVFKTEELVFFDFLVYGDVIYAGTRGWNEFREKSK